MDRSLTLGTDRLDSDQQMQCCHVYHVPRAGRNVGFAPVSASGRRPSDSPNLLSPLLPSVKSCSDYRRVRSLGLDLSGIIRSQLPDLASWSIPDRAYLAIAKCRTLHLCRNSAPPPINASEVSMETRVQLSTRPVSIRTMIRAPMAPGARAR
jgi:hypothetical protein